MPPFRPPTSRRRPRHGSLERPVNARAYRGTALLVAIPLLITAFTITRPERLPPPTFPAAFDEVGATQSARELATQFPNRTPGSPTATEAADWVAERLASFGFRVQRDRFQADVTGEGQVGLENVIAVSPGRSPDVLVVMAHRDNLGTTGQGANDNASGTGVLLELARGYGLRAAPAPGQERAPAGPAHTIVLVSSDGGAYGGLGAVRFLETSPYRRRISAAVNLVAIGGDDTVRIEIASDRPRSPDATLVETAAERIIQRTGREPRRTSAAGQLVDLAFPFSFYEQAPLIGAAIPALSLTTAGPRPPRPETDTLDRLNDGRIGQIGRAAEALLGSLDEGVALARDTSTYLYLEGRTVQGWAVQLVLIMALLPFLLAAVDLFARCRRRRIPLAPALRSYRTRLAFWFWVGLVFGFLALVGAWPQVELPPPPGTSPAGDWPVVALTIFAVFVFASWLVGRERLLPRRPVSLEEELAGQTTALLVLAVLALLTLATNAFALIFLLPSLHAWLWLPQVRHGAPWVRAGVLALGFLGPAILLGSFAWRFELGFDAPWYVLELVAIGYVPLPAIVIALGWFAAAGQLAAIATGRYAPYPDARERPPRGPVRQLVGRLLGLALGRKPTELKRAVGS
ncbi:MAG TPA: M28 family peptidase [Gaiellaceae bacterium]|nr:M28 family peptidase [Gaiellaceae bacterium]